MLKFITVLLVLMSLRSNAWTCDDRSGNTLEVVEDNREIYGTKWNALIKLQGPAIDYLFPEKFLLQEKHAFEDRVPSFNFDEKSSTFAIMSSGFSKYHSIRCERSETCVQVIPSDTGVKVLKLTRNEGLVSKLEWEFDNCK